MRGRVTAGTKGQARVQFDADGRAGVAAARCGLRPRGGQVGILLMPARHDPDTLPDVDRPELRLGHAHPVGIGYLAHLPVRLMQPLPGGIQLPHHLRRIGPVSQQHNQPVARPGGNMRGLPGFAV